MKRKSVLGAIGLLFVAGCASSPDDMQRAYVSPTQFAPLGCTQLSGELERVSSRKVELYKQLKSTSDNDAVQMGVGLILFWPTLFFLEGGDGPQAAEYSRLLGEEEAIEKTMVQKNCSAALIKVKKEVAPKEDVNGRLQKLEQLLRDGLITQEEFDSQRLKILEAI
ncbi:MAG TPA: metal ABC transporter ATP-binding protein [Rhodospirillaceae bacterium]|nr:metal ABC transporter ATP-binding protein [Rhodospirillaceae bacterium]